MSTTPPIGDQRFATEAGFRIAEDGLSGADDGVELVEGEIVGVSASGIRHSAVPARRRAWFVPAARRGAVRTMSWWTWN